MVEDIRKSFCTKEKPRPLRAKYEKVEMTPELDQYLKEAHRNNPPNTIIAEDDPIVAEICNGTNYSKSSERLKLPLELYTLISAILSMMHE